MLDEIFMSYKKKYFTTKFLTRLDINNNSNVLQLYKVYLFF